MLPLAEALRCEGTSLDLKEASLSEIGWLGRIRPFPCGKTSPASGHIRARASENQ